MAKRPCAVACTVALVVLAAACSGDASNAEARRPSSRCAVSRSSATWPMFGRERDAYVRVPVELQDRRSRPTVPSHGCGRSGSYKTADVVTATPAIADDTAFVGDWSGTFYALSLADGTDPLDVLARRRRRTCTPARSSRRPRSPTSGGERRVFFASGKTAVRGATPPTASCGGSTRSIRAATPTTSPRSSRRRSSRTAW